MMISDLPLDVESEILYRVPIKSRLKLFLTCKRWCDLLKQWEVILLMNYGFYSIRYNLMNRSNPSIGFRGNLRALDVSLKIVEIFHCDGLILCKTKDITRVVVWNPCTGATKWIERKHGYTMDDMFVLGYHENNEKSCCREYKILRIFHYNNELGRAVTGGEIYEFRSDSWRYLDNNIHGWNISSLGVSLGGNTYWIAKDEGTPTGFVQRIVGFDFATERFGYLPLPYQSDDREYRAVLSVVRGEKLAVLRQNLPLISDEMKIWVTSKIVGTKGVAWSDFLSVDFGKFGSRRQMEVKSFLVDEENKVALCCDIEDVEDKYKSSICMVGTDIHIRLGHKITNKSCPHLVSYVPSLVHIQKDTPKAKRKRKTTRMKPVEEILVAVRKSTRRRYHMDNYFPKT